jgi:hypothetical protein
MENIYADILKKLDEHRWRGSIAPHQPVKWGEFKKLLLELSQEKERENRKTKKLADLDDANIKSVDRSKKMILPQPGDIITMDHSFPYGKYKHMSVGAIVHTDPGYICWCIDNWEKYTFDKAVKDAVEYEDQEDSAPRGALSNDDSPNDDLPF